AIRAEGQRQGPRRQGQHWLDGRGVIQASRAKMTREPKVRTFWREKDPGKVSQNSRLHPGSGVPEFNTGVRTHGQFIAMGRKRETPNIGSSCEFGARLDTGKPINVQDRIERTINAEPVQVRGQPIYTVGRLKPSQTGAGEVFRVAHGRSARTGHG